MLGSDIRELVRIKLEEYSPYNPSTDGPLLSGGDILEEIKPIMAYVDAHLSEAANEMLLVAPIRVLNAKFCNIAPMEDDDDPFIGTISTPSDYLKIHTFKMYCWKKPVHVTYKAGDYMDSRQTYYTTRGNIYKPVVIEDVEGVRTYDKDSRISLRYYSTDGCHDVETYTYVPMFSLTSEYGDKVAELIALNCAKKVCEVFERTDAASIVNNEMQSVLQVMSL